MWGNSPFIKKHRAIYEKVMARCFFAFLSSAGKIFLLKKSQNIKTKANESYSLK